MKHVSKILTSSCVVDTGLSDFHKMTVNNRSHLNKVGSEIIHYRDYKNFSNDAFRSELVIKNWEYTKL